MSSPAPRGGSPTGSNEAGEGASAQPPVALYVHVPFCVSICPYCDFVVYAGAASRGPTARVEAFVEALLVELELRAAELDHRFGPPGPAGSAGAGAGSASGSRSPLASVYLGGGTPSLLPAATVSRLLDAVRERYGLAADAEITVESNPGPDERGDLAGFAAAGVNRVSFGAQSLDPVELRRLGRRHRPGDVAAAVGAAGRAGIASVNVDLLYDVPGQSVDSWRRSLDGVIALAPDHLSLYALTLDDPDAEGLTGASGDHLPVSAGARRWREKARSDQDEDRAVQQYTYAVRRLAAAGWRGYEISNWARPGHESRHNLAYWRRQPYAAVGPGAHAFDGRTRRWNAARLDGYLAALSPPDGAPPDLPPGSAETIDPSSAAAERVILALRTADGLEVDAALQPPFDGPLNWALAEGLAMLDPDDRIRLTTRGRLLSNELFSRLI